MITYAAFVILLFTADGPHYMDALFDNHFNCQQAESATLTAAAANPKVTGWKVLVDCPAVSEDLKS